MVKYCFVAKLRDSQRVKDQFKRLLLSVGINEGDYVLGEEEKVADVVIPLGVEGLQIVLGRNDIQNCRGGIYEKEGQKIVPTFDPEQILKGGGTGYWYLPAAVHDLKRAKEVADGKTSKRSPSLRLMQNVTELEQWFSQLVFKVCAFDIETTLYGGEWIKCIGFAASDDEGVVVPFTQGDTTEMLDVLSVIKKWMSSEGIRWIGQNAYNFDIPYIKRAWGFEVKNLWVDTMVLHHMLYPEFPHDLATIASFYTEIPYWKDTSGEDLYKYNAFDTVATFTSAMRMIEEAKKSGQWEIYESYYRPLLTPLRIISERGIRIDKEYQKEMKDVLKGTIKALQFELDEIYQRYANTNTLKLRLRGLQRFTRTGKKSIRLWNEKKQKTTRCRVESQIKLAKAAIEKKETLNVRSVKDLAGFLYGTLGLPAKTKMGKVTTDETALNQLYIKTKHPFLKTMISLRQKRNCLSRWGNLKTDEEGLISTTYSFAETGRLRSGRFKAK